MEKAPQSFYTVRFSDCDPFGHLNNSRYLDYLLNAREDHLKDNYQFDLAGVYKQGLGWVVNSHQLQYLRPAVYNEKVCIQSVLIDMSESHLLVEMSMWDEAVQVCKAVLWTKFTHINLKTGRKEQHGDAFAKFAADVLNTDIKAQDGFEKRVSLIGVSRAAVQPS
jgi:YbgC/YbaW family acyl-CoA thioester hydrolase